MSTFKNCLSQPLIEDYDLVSKMRNTPKDDYFDTNIFKYISLEWLMSQLPQLKPSSVAKYRNILKSYLVPKFGTFDIEAIARADVISYSRELLCSGGKKACGLSPKTVNSIISVLKCIFIYASREKECIVADIKDISVKQQHRPMRILSRSEQQKLCTFLCDNLTPIYLGIILCLFTGLRIGELCALRWGDISIEEQYIYVRRTMQRIQISGNSGKRTKIIIHEPKSECSIRKIPIPNDLIHLMLPFRKKEDAFLLTGVNHKYVEPRCLENHFKDAVGECDIKDGAVKKSL